MAAVRKVHTAWARQVARHLEARGRPSGLILKEVGLDASGVQDADARIPFAKQAALFEAAASHLNDPCFGLHFGSSVNPLDVGVLGYVGTSSPTFGDGLRNIVTYLRVSTEGVHGKLAIEDRLAFFTVEIIDPRTRHRQQMYEFGLVMVMSFVRLIAGRRLIPEWVEFRHNRAEDLEGFERFFGCSVRFGQRKTSIVLKRGLLDLPSKSADERLLHILKGHCEGILDKRGDKADLKDEVEYLVASHLQAGAPVSQLVARELGMSERTMARRLAGLGTSFGQILEDVRRQLAIRYLDEPEVRTSQIAYLLGYSEPSAFNHAFRRWTGVSPSEFVAAQ